MSYDHIFIASGKQNFATSGITELFELYPPRKVLLLYQGELQHPPDDLKNLVVNSYDGEFLPETKLTALGDSTSELETKALPYTVFPEMQSAIVNHFPECFHDNNAENELVTTMMSGSGLHRQLFLGLSIAINTTLVTNERGANNTRIITPQKWINAGFKHGDLTRAQRDLLRAFLIQLTLNGRDGTKKPNEHMSAENIMQGLNIKTIANATGVSNPANGLINKGIIEKIPDSEPTLYHLTGKGWITALKVLSEQLEMNGVPLSGYDIGENRFLESIFSETDEVVGRTHSVKGVLVDGEVTAIELEQNYSKVPVIMTIFSRKYDDSNIGIISEQEFEITGDMGSFIAAREKWEEHIKYRRQEQLDWGLFNTSGIELEESFRLLCVWLWPKITGLQYTASDKQKRNIQWSIDSTQFDLLQSCCISLFSFLFSIPITYLQRSSGPPGVSGRNVNFIGSPASCIITMPNRELMKGIWAIDENELSSQSKILIALWLREQENQRLQNEHESAIHDIDDPFEELHDDYSPPSNEVYIEELHDRILTLVQNSTIDNKFQLDAGGDTPTDKNRRAQQWKRASKHLSKHRLAKLVHAKSGTQKLLLLTPLGRIVAEKIYNQHKLEG